MGLNIITLGSGKNYTNQVALGIGNMRVEGTTVYFTIIETGEEVSVTLPTPDDGVSIENIVLNSDNTITCSMSDGTTKTTDPLVIDTTNIAYTTSKDATIKNVKNALDKAMNINVSTLEYTPSVDATIHTVEDALNKLITKTDAELESPLVSNVAIGSIVSGTTFPKGTSLEEIIRQMLTQYIKPVVNLVINPNQTLYDEVEDSLTSITLNAVVTKKTSDIAKVEFYVNNTLVSTITANVTNGGTFPYIYTPATPITDDTSFRVVVTDVEDGEGTMSKAITFIGNSYYGIVEPTTGTVSEATIKTLNKNLKNTNDFVYSNISCEYNKIVYCYPSELGKLSTIADEKNSFNYMESFECQNVTVDGIPYYAYVLIEPTGVDSAEITFK